MNKQNSPIPKSLRSLAGRCIRGARNVIFFPAHQLSNRFFHWRAKRRIRRQFPGSTFVGPYEKHGRYDAMWQEQWLWSKRNLIRGEVLDMSTPRELHDFIHRLPRVENVIISDLSDEYVEKLGFKSKVDIIGDFCDDILPVSDDSFDTVLCLSILEHCVEPDAMVKNIARILRGNGHAFFACPFAYLDGHISPDYWRFCRDAYVLFAERARLDVVEIGQFDDLSKAYYRQFGVRLNWGQPYRGIPMGNWMIARSQKA